MTSSSWNTSQRQGNEPAQVLVFKAGMGTLEIDGFTYKIRWWTADLALEDGWSRLTVKVKTVCDSFLEDCIYGTIRAALCRSIQVRKRQIRSYALVHRATRIVLFGEHIVPNSPTPGYCWIAAAVRITNLCKNKNWKLWKRRLLLKWKTINYTWKLVAIIAPDEKAHRLADLNSFVTSWS